MYIFKSNINQKEYDHFVENHPSCSLLQSYKWANIKNNWKPIYTGVYEKDTLVAAGLVLIRPLPLSFSMFYLPRGPILDYKNKELLNYMKVNMEQFALNLSTNLNAATDDIRDNIDALRSRD